MKILYISYDGATDNLGQSQIIPYIAGLSQRNIFFTILTFEKKESLKNKTLMDSIRSRLNYSVVWIPLKYHKTPSLLATLYDIAYGSLIGLRIIKKRGVKFIHSRSFIGSVIALVIKKLCSVKIILDIRGFWPEERVEAGLWKKSGWLFKIAKLAEKAIILNADSIVVLTLEGRNEIKKAGYFKSNENNITVIPTCVNINNEVPEKSSFDILNSLSIHDKFVISYIGSVSTWYMLTEMFRFFSCAQKIIKNSFFLILTSENEYLEYILKKENQKTDSISILNVDHKLVPQYLSVSKVGLAFYKPGYSRKACSPTKFGEYLAQGLPVIINRGIGDCDDIVTKEKVGVLIDDFSVEEYSRAIHEIMDLLSEDNLLRDRCKAVAKKYFSLDMGIERYLDIYKRLSLERE